MADVVDLTGGPSSAAEPSDDDSSLIPILKIENGISIALHLWGPESLFQTVEDVFLAIKKHHQKFLDEALQHVRTQGDIQIQLQRRFWVSNMSITGRIDGYAGITLSGDVERQKVAKNLSTVTMLQYAIAVKNQHACDVLIAMGSDLGYHGQREMNKFTDLARRNNITLKPMCVYPRPWRDLTKYKPLQTATTAQKAELDLLTSEIDLQKHNKDMLDKQLQYKQEQLTALRKEIDKRTDDMTRMKEDAPEHMKELTVFMIDMSKKNSDLVKKHETLNETLATKEEGLKSITKAIVTQSENLAALETRAELIFSDSSKKYNVSIETLRTVSMLTDAQLETFRDSLQRICKICDTAYRDTVFNCDHLVLCANCANLVTECPMCRAPLTKRQKVYIS